MDHEIRDQPRCYYLTPEYARSFWGRYCWIYQGKGRLRLTSDGLRLECAPLRLEILLHAIKSVELGRFSSWAKPFGLNYLIVRYAQDGEAETIHLIPYESAFAPTWKTSELVVSWLDTLRGIDELAGRVASPDIDPAPSAPSGFRVAFVAALLVLPVTTALLTWILLH